MAGRGGDAGGACAGADGGDFGAGGGFAVFAAAIEGGRVGAFGDGGGCAIDLGTGGCAGDFGIGGWKELRPGGRRAAGLLGRGRTPGSASGESMSDSDRAPST
jgi:hypothetical protein